MDFNSPRERWVKVEEVDAFQDKAVPRAVSAFVPFSLKFLRSNQQASETAK